MQLRKHVLGILFALLGVLSALLVIGCINYKQVLADKNYLEIYPDDFVPTSVNDELSNYYIVYADYTDEEELPQGSYRSYTNLNVEIACNLEKPTILSHVQAQNSSSKVAFYFYKILPKSLEDKQPFDDSVTRFVISDGTQFDAHADYATTYVGIRFCGDAIFEWDGATWKTVIEEDTNTESDSNNKADSDIDDESDSDTDIEEENAPKRTTLRYNEEIINSFAFNEESNRLEATIQLPYTAEEKIVYEGDLAYTVSGGVYIDKVKATQEENTSTLLLSFENSEILKSASGVSILLSETTFTNETVGELVLLGTITYYGYTDGSWLTRQCAEILKQIEDECFFEKVPLDEEKYILPAGVAIEDKLFIGWEFKGELYPKGAEIEINANDKLIEIEARYITFELMDGASIRYGKNSSDTGIRFSGKLHQFDFVKSSDDVVGLGMILMATDLMEEGKEFTLANYNQEGQAKDTYICKEEITFDESGVFKLNIALINVLQRNFNRAFSARVYAKIKYATGEDYVWGEKIENRSVYQVASNALNDENRETIFTDSQIELLQSYTQMVLNLHYDGENVTLINVGATLTSAPPQIIVLENNVTIRLTTAITSIPCVSYNGNRVRYFEDGWENGVLTISFSMENV